MCHFGVACGHFQFSVTPQGVDSVLAGNGPSKGTASWKSPPLSPRCAQIRRAFAQVIHRFAHRQALACGGASREIAGAAARHPNRGTRGSRLRWVRCRRHSAATVHEGAGQRGGRGRRLFLPHVNRDTPVICRFWPGRADRSFRPGGQGRRMPGGSGLGTEHHRPGTGTSARMVRVLVSRQQVADD